MASSTTSFRVGLYLEHLEEAAALYEQRAVLQNDPEVPWFGLADFEERLDAHLDALVIGGQVAADTCRARAHEGDPAELFAAVCVFCRGMRVGALAEVLQSVDYGEQARTTALTDALKYELPEQWRDFCSRAVASGDPQHVPALAEVLAYRRLVSPQVLLERLGDAGGDQLPRLLWSVGRCGDESALPVVRAMLGADDGATAAAALHTALRLEDWDAWRWLVASTGEPAHGLIGLGLAGGPGVAPVLLRSIRDDSNRSLQSITAIGLLGDPGTVRALVDLLAVEALADAAAEALRVITGAPLVEAIRVPEQMIADEMFPEEIAAFRATGELPRRSDGEAYGTTVNRGSRNPTVWQEWLTANASQFMSGHRYRFGRLCTPRVLVDCLRSAIFPKAYRRWLPEELMIRYRIDLPLEHDMYVAQQRRVLMEAAATIERASQKFEPGQWYFAGDLLV